MRSSVLVSSANGASSPSAALTSAPRPSVATASWSIHERNASRVGASNARKISSSSTVGATCPAGSRPPSGSFGADAEPGVSSTYVSPSSVFWRRIARVSLGTGA